MSHDGEGDWPPPHQMVINCIGRDTPTNPMEGNGSCSGQGHCVGHVKRKKKKGNFSEHNEIAPGYSISRYIYM